MIIIQELANDLKVIYADNSLDYVAKKIGRVDVSGNEVFQLFLYDKEIILGKYENVTLRTDLGDSIFTSFDELYEFLTTTFAGGDNVSIVDESGNSLTQENPLFTSLAKNDLGYDAWGRPKFVKDNSLFHALFTYNIPVTTWYESVNDVISTTPVNNTSVNGSLVVKAGANLSDNTFLRSYRNLRYEPNRGYIYSTATIIKNPNALMNRRFGAATKESGVLFSLESGVLYGVVRTTRDGVTSEDKVALNTEGIDLSKGNVYDIQFQWRGVGNYKFFINLKYVGGFDYLGTLTEISMFNPSLPCCFESENLGDNEEMVFGCVDITSEGGKNNGKTYGSVSITNETGQVSIDDYNKPIIAIRSKAFFDGLINTRDTIALLASAYGDQRCVFRVWTTRDFTAITDNDQPWMDFGDGHLEYLQYDNPNVANPMEFDTSKAELIFGCRVDQDQTYSTSALFEGRTDIYLTPNDMFIFTMHRETGGGANVGVTFEFAEEI